MSEPVDGADPSRSSGPGSSARPSALALRRAGIDVLLADANPDHLRTASGLGAGRPATDEDRPQLVVVAVPPDHLGAVIRDALERTDAVVTDVGSVKSEPAGGRLAGRPGSSATSVAIPWRAASAPDPWPPARRCSTAGPGRSPRTRPPRRAPSSSWRRWPGVCGAVPVRLSPVEHDAAVARTSHVPHVLASLVAGQLLDAPADHLTLSGQGVRDVTRVAGGDPALYGQIVSANGDQVLALLLDVRDRLDEVIEAVGRARPGRPGVVAA